MQRMRVPSWLAWCTAGLVLDALLLAPSTLFLSQASMLDGLPDVGMFARAILCDLTLLIVAWLVHVHALPSLLGTVPGARGSRAYAPLALVLLVFGTALAVAITAAFSLLIGILLLVFLAKLSAPGTPASRLMSAASVALPVMLMTLTGTLSGCLLHLVRHDLVPPIPLVPVPAEALPSLPRLRWDALGGAAAMLVTMMGSALVSVALDLHTPGLGPVLDWPLASHPWLSTVIAPLALLPHLILTAPGGAQGRLAG